MADFGPDAGISSITAPGGQPLQLARPMVNTPPGSETKIAGPVGGAGGGAGAGPGAEVLQPTPREHRRASG
eukprot:SAG31_NODE_30712_length_377_cov_0.726619_1_plen_70_part_10